MAMDGELPRDKVRERSNTIKMERLRIQNSLIDTTAELEVGAERLRDCLRLLQDPVSLYEQAPDGGRRQINEAFYECFYLDDLDTTNRIEQLRMSSNHRSKRSRRPPNGTRSKTTKKAPTRR